jgi:glycosyltransferase involved in cell wall biosynthesis
MGPPGSSTSIHNKGPVPSSIEPLRQPRNSSQAKHVPRGQRGLGRGSIAVSCGAVFILLHHLHRCHLVNSLTPFPFPLGLGLRILRLRCLNQHTRRVPIHRTRRVPRISPFHRIERIVLGRGTIPYYRLIFRHSHDGTDSPSRTIARYSIPRCFRFSRALKRYSVTWSHLAVVWAVWSMVNMALTVADDRIG